MSSRLSRDTYVLQRGANASTRLTAQHFLWKTALGYTLHPSIPIPTSPRIADVATGNGLWLLDFDRDLPASVTLDGFDIRLDQVPTIDPTSASFPNLRFHQWDILEEPAEEFAGAFDIVHVRLISVLIREDNLVPIINNVRRLLKPGGFLQWEEVDNTTCNVLTPPAMKAPALEAVLAQLATAGKGDWKQRGNEILGENGFHRIQQLHLEQGRSLAKFWTDIYLGAWAEFVSHIGGHVLAEAEGLGEEASKDAGKGAVINCPLWVWIAQKC